MYITIGGTCGNGMVLGHANGVSAYPATVCTHVYQVIWYSCYHSPVLFKESETSIFESGFMVLKKHLSRWILQFFKFIFI